MSKKNLKIKNKIKFIDIPYDVLHFHLVPFLSSVDILNLNETLPTQYRIIKKFKKQWIHDHHEKVLIEKFTLLMSRADLNKGQEKYYHILYKLVKELNKPINFQLYIQNSKFTNALINKLDEFIHHDLSRIIPISLKWYYMFQRQCQKTLETILFIKHSVF
jgi:hypothetical protein